MTLGSAIIVITCSTGRDRPVPPPAGPMPIPPMEPAANAATGAAPGAAASAEPSATPHAAPPLEPPTVIAAAATAGLEVQPPEGLAQAAAAPRAGDQPAQGTQLTRGRGHELDNFYGALRGLEKHTRAEHVRVVWLGDSHGASDFWSGALRSALQKRFGNGGPGFVHIGNRGYRHDGIKMEIPGKWRTRPKGPATSIPQGDGIFGLSGILMSSEDPGPRAAITVADPSPPLTPPLTFDLCYKLATPHDEIAFALTSAPAFTARASAAEPPGALRHVSLTTSSATPTLGVAIVSGVPELCGVVIEADPKVQPGVVLDTLGINGARLTTPLAWNEASWTSELARRSPSLVILEYGTNESGDHTIQPDLYTRNLMRLMARVHTVAPAADCLVLAPTDRADTSDRTPLVRDALKEAARAVGCGFWDTYATMGGKGSILAWRGEMPPRAAPDGVHLVFRGYRDLGDKLASDLLASFVP